VWDGEDSGEWYVYDGNRQGQVLRELAEGHYLVQWYEWLVGAPSWSSVLHVGELSSYKHFTDVEHWRDHTQRDQDRQWAEMEVEMERERLAEMKGETR
jgi:hypothetical protein